MFHVISDGVVKTGVGKTSGKPYSVQVCALDDGGLGAVRFERFINDREPVIPAGRFELPAGVRAYVREERLCLALDISVLKAVQAPASVATPEKERVQFGRAA